MFRTTKKIIAPIAAAAVVALAAFVLMRHPASPGAALQPVIEAPAGSPAAGASAGGYGGDLSERYTSAAYHFSFAYPAGYSVRESPADPANPGGTFVIQNASSTDGIQIVVSPDTDDRDITAAKITADIPDMAVDDPHAIVLEGREVGTAFGSDNGAFNGASYEAWFVSGGNLYQVSTYARDQALLRAIFATWQFN